MTKIFSFAAYAGNGHQKNITLPNPSKLQYVLHKSVLINNSYEPYIEYTLKVRQPDSRYFISCNVFDGKYIYIKADSSFESIVKDLIDSIKPIGSSYTYSVTSLRLEMTLPMIQKKMPVIQKAILAIIPQAIERKLIKGV